MRHWVLEDLGSHEDFRGGSWVRRPVAPRAEPVGMPIRCFQCDGTRCSIFEMAAMGFCVVEVHRGDSVPRRISPLRFGRPRAGDSFLKRSSNRDSVFPGSHNEILHCRSAQLGFGTTEDFTIEILHHRSLAGDSVLGRSDN